MTSRLGYNFLDLPNLFLCTNRHYEHVRHTELALECEGRKEKDKRGRGLMHFRFNCLCCILYLIFSSTDALRKYSKYSFSISHSNIEMFHIVIGMKDWRSMHCRIFGKMIWSPYNWKLSQSSIFTCTSLLYLTSLCFILQVCYWKMEGLELAILVGNIMSMNLHGN